MYKESRTFKSTKNYVKRTISDNEVRIYHYVSIHADSDTQNKMNQLVYNWLTDVYQKFEYDSNFDKCVEETARIIMEDMIMNPSRFDNSWNEYVLRKRETNEPVMIYNTRFYDNKVETKYIFYKV